MAKKPKTPFSFKDITYQQVVDHLNDEYPISIKHNEDLINRVYARYPLITKAQIGTITKAIFLSMRDLLILGRVLSFRRLFVDVKLLFFPQRLKGRIYPAMKTQMTTPPRLRKPND